MPGWMGLHSFHRGWRCCLTSMPSHVILAARSYAPRPPIPLLDCA